MWGISVDAATRLRENATEVAATIVTGVWLFLLFSGIGGGLWLAVLLVGYIVIVPMVALLFGDEDDVREWWDEDEIDFDSLDEPADGGPSTRDALETLRNRYAVGELTDDQFERKLERLLETETIEDVEEWTRRERAGDLEYER